MFNEEAKDYAEKHYAVIHNSIILRKQLIEPVSYVEAQRGQLQCRLVKSKRNQAG